MDEMKIPSVEELAEIVYKYCKTNNITYIREDELVKKIADNETQNMFSILKEKYNLDEKGYGEDEESSEAVTIYMANLLMFSFRLSKRFYEIIDILIEECKADRKKREGEKFYYLTFYLTPSDIEAIKLCQSSIEIMAKNLYNIVKENNVERIEKDRLESILNLDDKIISDKILNFLVNKDMARICFIEDENYIVFNLTETKIALNKNMRLMIKNLAESLLNSWNEEKIEYIEKDELQKVSELNDAIYEDVLDYLVTRHLVDIEENDEDGKVYVRVYE